MAVVYINECTYSLTGLSTQVKPKLNKVNGGSLFTETDTGKTYIFDAKSKSWVLLTSDVSSYIANVAYNSSKYYNEHIYCITGSSTDKKPKFDEKSNGSRFIETDTGKIYIYSSATQEWKKLDTGGSGGKTYYAGEGIKIDEEDTIAVDTDKIATVDELAKKSTVVANGKNPTGELSTITIDGETYTLTGTIPANVVTLDTVQKITAEKTFTNGLAANKAAIGNFYADSDGIYVKDLESGEYEQILGSVEKDESAGITDGHLFNDLLNTAYIAGDTTNPKYVTEDSEGNTIISDIALTSDITTVEANPTAASTTKLDSVKIGDSIYSIDEVITAQVPTAFSYDHRQNSLLFSGSTANPLTSVSTGSKVYDLSSNEAVYLENTGLMVQREVSDNTVKVQVREAYDNTTLEIDGTLFKTAAPVNSNITITKAGLYYAYILNNELVDKTKLYRASVTQGQFRTNELYQYIDGSGYVPLRYTNADVHTYLENSWGVSSWNVKFDGSVYANSLTGEDIRLKSLNAAGSEVYDYQALSLVDYTHASEEEKAVYEAVGITQDTIVVGNLEMEAGLVLAGNTERPLYVTVDPDTGDVSSNKIAFTTDVVANPETEATENLEKLTVNGKTYKIEGSGTGADEDTFTFKNDLTTMYNVGKVEATVDNPTTIPAAGKTFKEVWNSIFVNVINPTVVQPSWSAECSASDVTGAVIDDATVTLTFHPGSYSYGPDPTGVIVTHLVVEGEEQTLTDNQVTLTVDELTVPSTATSSFTYSYSGASDPLNNIGEGVSSLKIADVTDAPGSFTKSFVSTGTLGVKAPSINLTKITPSAGEVGTSANGSFSLSINNSAGYYPYGSVEYPSQKSAQCAQLLLQKKIDTAEYEDTGVGVFSIEKTFTDSAQSTSMFVKYNYAASALTPLSPKGHKVPSAQLKADNLYAVQSMLVPAGYRKIFYGYSKTDELTSATIRALPNSKKNDVLDGVLFDEDSTAKCIIIAAPSGTRTLTKVIMPSSSDADVTSQFVKQAATVDVEGANGYKAIAYDVWVYEPAIMNGTYKVTMA